MGCIYARHRRLWIKYRDESGAWRYKKTPYLVDRDEKLAKELLREVESGIEARRRAAADGGPLTVKAYALGWMAKREGDASASGRHSAAKSERTTISRHVFPALGDMLLKDVETRHVKEFVEALRTRKGRRGTLAPRTVCNIHGLLHTIFEHARADGLVATNPCRLPVGMLPSREDKDPDWRHTAIFTREEVELLISSPDTPPDRRLIYALLFLTGARWGEMAALQWRDWDTSLKPLGRLTISKSFSHHLGRVKGTKTGKTRLVPVHPTLARLLAEWRLAGWEQTFGRAPTPGDLIVPNAPVLTHSSGIPLAGDIQRAEIDRVRALAATATDRYRRPQQGLDRFHFDLKRLGLRPRRNHDTRRTLASLMLDDGARDPIRSYIIWGAPKSVRDLYTTLSWKTFCEEMSRLCISVREGEVIELPRAVENGAQLPEIPSVRVTGLVTGDVTGGNQREKLVGRTGFGPVTSTV